MRFTKMQGAGNDFVILDDRDGRIPDARLPELAARLCERRVSIGADGLMVVRGAESDGDFRMLFYNSDGSLGEMCGNGARCIARWGYERGLSGEEPRIETTSGLVIGKRLDADRYRVRLSDPTVLRPYLVVPMNGVSIDCAYAELGDPGLPHAIVRLDGFERVPEDELRRFGASLCHHPVFPKGANVTFWRQTAPDSFTARTFERGVEDFTLACGTGAGSLAAALTVRGLCGGKNIRVLMPGGELSVSLTAEGDWVHDVFLTGPAVTVFEGETPDK